MSDQAPEPKDLPTLPLLEEKPSLIKNRYRLEKELGRGGMGVVFLARDQELHNRAVVIKVLRDIAPGEWHTKKFRQEIEALVRIEHPGVVGVFDAGEMPNGQLFVVMQYVEGVTLRSIINEGPLDVERAAQIIEEIGLALNAAHEKGILHCDLKPENIMLQKLQRGQQIVKLIDFGIAKIRDSQVSSSHSTKIAGTIEYMPPEQLNGAPCVASDIFAAGVIAFEMLTGRKPFPAQSILQLVEMHRVGLQTSAKELRPELSASVDPILRKALDYDPQLRYENAADFGTELSQTLKNRASEVPTAILPVESAPSSRNAFGILAVLFLLIAGVVAFFFLRPGKSIVSVSPKQPPVVVTKKTAAPAPVPVRQLMYWIAFLRARDDRPVNLPEGLNFQAGDRIQLHIKSPHAGSLYVLNEGPAQNNGMPDYVVWFPSEMNGNNSSRIAENQDVQIPRGQWLKFDQQKGTEKTWIVFSKAPLAELEPIKSFSNKELRGQVKDPALGRSVHSFLQTFERMKIEKLRDEEQHLTVLKSETDPLVYRILLEHH